MRFLIIILLLTSHSFARDAEIQKAFKESFGHYKKKDYFTALDIIAKKFKYQTPDKKLQKYIELLVGHTGTHFFNTYTDLELRKLNIPTSDLIMAKRNLYLDKFDYVHKRLDRMPKSHRLYPESLLVKGTAYLKAKEYQKAIATYKNCSDISYSWEKQTDNKKQNYFAIIKESCIINIARIHFKQKNYLLAI